KYAVVDDLDIDSPADEYRRNVIWTTETTVQVIQADGQSQLRWSETSAAVAGPPAVPAGPKKGDPIPSSQITLLRKTKRVMNLLRWSFDYVSSEIDVPTLPHFDSIVGTVNTQGLLSAKAGTLLCLGYGSDVFEFPVV